MLHEFKRFIQRDVDTVQTLVAYGIAKNEDLGMNFGDRENRFYDEDLENETLCPESYTDEKRVRAKYGLDHTEQSEARELHEWEKMAQSLEPTNASSLIQKNHDSNLELEYIYGYRCHDARNNLRYTEDGKLVYHAAGAGVVMNQSTNT